MQPYRVANINSDTRLFDLILDNSKLLLLLEHFDVDFKVQDKTIKELCVQNRLSEAVFLDFINLYYGNQPINFTSYVDEDIKTILLFLRNCHKYYKEDKYPEIIGFIRQLKEADNSIEIRLIEKFFNEYFDEVNEHLNYEEEIVFPYLYSLLDSLNATNPETFSVSTYKSHHSDIEYKLDELKNILLKVVTIKNQQIIVRKLLISLFELEHDLHIHSLIEEGILTPLGKKLENRLNDELQ